VDSELGLLFNENYQLAPGGSMFVSTTVGISVTTVNSATWTAYNPGPSDTVTAADTVTVTVVPAALIVVDPLNLYSLQGPDEKVSMPLDIANNGDSPLQWLLYEEESLAADRPSSSSRKPEFGSPSYREQVVIRSDEECPKYENYAGAEPEGFVEFCMDQVPVRNSTGAGFASGPTDIAYAHDIRINHGNFVWHHLNNFPGQVVVGVQPASIFGYDFDVTGRILYGLNDDTFQLGIVDTNNGAFSSIGSSIPISTSEFLIGLTIHPVTGEAYAATTDGIKGRIYDIDLTTGAMSFIGGDESIPFLIDIAMNPEGVMYGHDISSDSIYTIDVSTGLATLIGPTGIDANFSQGMDFDNYDGTLYAWIYEGGGLNQYGIIDLDTGALTTLAIDDPLGEFEGATQTPLFDSCDLEDDVPWLSASPTSGTVNPGTSQTISITVDSTNLAAGMHHGLACIESNDFFGTIIRIPVTLEVESVASVRLKKTVGLERNECATTDLISVQSGTRVYYCYEITNAGSVPFSRHDLVDSQFEDPIFDGLSALLLPGESLRPIIDAFIFETTINTATWSAYNPGPTDLVSDSDTAQVVVSSFAIHLPVILRRVILGR